MSHASDPVPRAASSFSVTPLHHADSHPRHDTLPPSRNQSLQNYLQPQSDVTLPSSSTDHRQHDTPGPMYDAYDAYGHDPHQLAYEDNTSAYHSSDALAQAPHFRPPQQRQWQQTPRVDSFNSFYAAASDVLGMAPPPSTHAVPDNSVSSLSSHSIDYPSYASSHTSLSSGQSTISVHSQASLDPMYPPQPYDNQEFEPRPSLHRAGTSASVTLSTNKSKAIDLSAPPYTKEYIDQYRQRIKADPDPEAHFLYAKYLIDAAKKIRASAKDQRSAKKYSEVLIGESLKVIKRLATQGEAYDEAQFFLANCHGTGALGLQVDHERAYHLYLQAAKQNHAAACYRVAVCNEIGAGTRKEPPRASAFYRKAASLGDTPAMYKLGMILLHGSLGEQKNPREAVNWLKRAAEQGDEDNPHALHELGLLHEQPGSTLVPYEPAYAKSLFTQAAQLGYTQSQYKLGQCYEYGSLTCPVDPRRSIAWYTKAAEKGDAEAELALSGWYLTGSEGVLKQSDSEAYLWARRAANKGLSKAEYAVGYYAEVGIGIKQDVEFAKRWYMRAAGTFSSS